MNVSVTRSGCCTNVSAVLRAGEEQKGSVSLYLTSHPGLSLKASVQNSVEEIQMLGFPSHGALMLNVSAAHQPGVEFGLELGRCYIRGQLGEARGADGNHSSYAVNVTNYCPSLKVRKQLKPE